MTGHYDPDVDVVLLPVNPVEVVICGFLDTVIPAARERGIGVTGMKILGAGNFIFPDAEILPDMLIRFALAQNTDIVIVGCSTRGRCRSRPVSPRRRHRWMMKNSPAASRCSGCTRNNPHSTVVFSEGVCPTCKGLNYSFVPYIIGTSVSDPIASSLR